MWTKMINGLEAQLEKAAEPQDTVINAVTKQLNDVTMHDYQIEGLRWLIHRDNANINSIVGDEMGLGKTLQTIAFICYLITTKPMQGPCLIVAPLSVLPNWEEQFGRFAPHLSLVTYSGTKPQRVPLEKKIKASKPNVVLTSYEIVLLESSFFKSEKWALAAFDEGHRLKNPKGKLYKVLLNELSFERKLLLTGTPVQNNMEELAALLTFLNPNCFTKNVVEEFKTADLPPLTLRALLAPFILLRTVSDVEGVLKLPPLTKVTVHTKMSPMQREYYKQIVSKGATTLSLMNILAQLRKACNHPYLFPNAEPEPFIEGPHLYQNSGKLHVLHALLPRLRAEGHIVLLFSISTAFLDIIQDYCTMQHFSYERLDGSIRGEERWETIDRFRKHDDAFLFLLSTRAGGVGLNLQRADTVIFCDVDYNPQMELQALARAYRMGQTKPIHILHLICQHSVEELIHNRCRLKLEMSKKVREASKLHVQDEKNLSCLEGLKDDAVLAYGLHHLLESEGEELQNLSNEEIEKLLDRTSASDHLANFELQESNKVDNMYCFEGTDYSSQDSASLSKLKKTARVSQRKTKTKVQYEDEDDDSQDYKETEEERAARKQANLEKRLALWKKHGYTSYVLQIDDAEEETFSDDEEPLELNYKSGNAAITFPTVANPIIIVHCVDTSGVWTNRGFFGAISHRSTVPQTVYAAAKKYGDLRLGQAHCIPLEEEPNVYICLLVVQSSTTSKVKLRNTKTLTFRLNALQESLRALAIFARKNNAHVDMPRLGTGTPNFNWYAVERLLKKHLAQQRVQTNIYYYAPSHKKAKSTSV
ncbi:chromodomain-helicase-DNA-binding protein 1 [Thraustotheca clavata]|uniref:Chromodomain-helicase-DNA-binding protein 1 n=1 Tax=Thraustotheca clavata TaxID=74557 RepID=A0A1W0A607_9STRA|nr:chromodomain-helicase-DNA-binding protein 1 [Thraustotheca clavata]